jgi:hypothetical protein
MTEVEALHRCRFPNADYHAHHDRAARGLSTFADATVLQGVKGSPLLQGLDFAAKARSNDGRRSERLKLWPKSCTIADLFPKAVSRNKERKAHTARTALNKQHSEHCHTRTLNAVD